MITFYLDSKLVHYSFLNTLVSISYNISVAISVHLDIFYIQQIINILFIIKLQNILC